MAERKRLASACALALSWLCAAPPAGAQHVYWYELHGESIERAPLAGGPAEVVVQELLSSPIDIALGADALYWRDVSRVMRSARDGTDVGILFHGASQLSGGDPSTPSIALDEGAGQIYWLETDGLGRASLDGSQADTILTGLRRPASLVIDAADGRLYWIAQGLIQRANLDGSGLEDVLDTGRFGMDDALALDPAGGRLYWANGLGVSRAHLDGSDAALVVSLDELGRSLVLALDLQGGKLYFGDITSGVVRRADLDGSNLEDLVSVGDVRSLVPDADSGWLYWAGREGVGRAQLDGSAAELLVAQPADRLLLDPAEGRLYWSDDGFGTAEDDARIRRSALDGTGVEDVQVPLLGLVRDIEIDARDERLYWVDGQRVREAGLDGDGMRDVVTVGPDSFPVGVALDPVAGKVYWSERSRTDAGGTVLRSNRDGSEMESVVIVPPGEYPTAVDLDPARGHLYWVQRGNIIGVDARLRRAGLDGSDVVDVIEAGTYNRLEPFALDPIDARVYLTFCSDSIWCLLPGPSDPSFVGRTTLTGAQLESLGIGRTLDVAVDPTRRRFYWLPALGGGSETIESAALDGTDPWTVPATPSSATVMALHLPVRPLTATGRIALKDGPGWRADALMDVWETIPSAEGVGSIGTASGLVKDVAVDPLSGDVFTVELTPGPGGQQVYRVDPESGAGAPLPHRTGLFPPAAISGLAFDAHGNLYGGGLGVHWIDTDTGRAYPLAGLRQVPGVILGMARSPLGKGFLSTGILVTRIGLVPYVALHDAIGRIVPGAAVPVVDGSGRSRLLLDMALTENGLLLGAALALRVELASAGSSREASRTIEDAISGRAGLQPGHLRERAEALWSQIAGLSLELGTDLVLVEGGDVSGIPIARLGAGAPLPALVLGLGPSAAGGSER